VVAAYACFFSRRGAKAQSLFSFGGEVMKPGISRCVKSSPNKSSNAA